jgi:4-alpha-glucanotransferase
MKRSSGIIMPIASLPSAYGIGTIGKSAFAFADFLRKAGQSYWQMLPMGPTGYGDSPYQSFSSHAGNPYFIDLELLAEEGLLHSDDIECFSWSDREDAVDYEKIYEHRFTVLRQAYKRGYAKAESSVQAFAAENAGWLPDYALFMALKTKFGQASWQEWPREVRFRNPDILAQYKQELREEIEFFSYLQYLFFTQWEAVKKYINSLGIKVIGDVPIYAALDSADVWANPSLFALDIQRHPRWVAGVPPDYFSLDGQLWGNPLYHWPAHKKTSFEWWISRLKSAERFADVIRIDHFRGFYNYWNIPPDALNARKGKWLKGPGTEFVRMLKDHFPQTPIIAEDLGMLSREVMDFVAASEFPGMKVLQFAFDASNPQRSAPHTFPLNSVCYTGTHDNTTARGWFTQGFKRDVALAEHYLGLNETEGFSRGFIRGGMACPSQLFIAQLQDWLDLDDTARINTPGTVGGNWRWRLTPGLLTDRLAKDMAYTTKIFGRSPTRRRK